MTVLPVADSTIWREYGTPLLPAVSRGLLDGVSVAVKDLFAVAGFPVGAGNPTWLEQAPVEAQDAWAVQAVRAAGAAVAGIARTDELAFSLSGTNAHYGTPPNPAAPDRVPGGSSSGPASAVASGEADLGLGTDTAGSVRVPASACGLYGLRPTHGAVPVDGLLPLAPSFDTVGWLARDASLLRDAGRVLLPPGDPAPAVALRCLDAPDDRTTAVADLLGTGVEGGPVAGLEDLDALLTAFRLVQGAEAWRVHGSWISAHPGALDADVEARFRFAEQVDPTAFNEAGGTLADRRNVLLDVLGDRTWLALPMGPGHPRDADAAAKDEWRMATLRGTVIASALGLPSCVLPSWVLPGTELPPAGLALVGPPGADFALLDAAVQIAALPAAARFKARGVSS